MNDVFLYNYLTNRLFGYTFPFRLPFPPLVARHAIAPLTQFLNIFPYLVCASQSTDRQASTLARSAVFFPLYLIYLLDSLFTFFFFPIFLFLFLFPFHFT